MGLEEEDLESRGFQAGVDLRALGAMAQSIWEWERERERKRESNTSQPNYKEKKKKGKVICMKNAWICNMQNLKTSWVKTQSKPTNT